MINGSQPTTMHCCSLRCAQCDRSIGRQWALKKVYEKFTPDWTNATAQTEMEGALTNTANNVAVAYVANDGMANSVIAALKAHHLNGKVLVTGQDATVAGIQNILTGDQA